MTGSLWAQDLDLQFTRVSGFKGVVDLANAGDGSGRLFLVQQLGRILIYRKGQDMQTTFLDIQRRVESREEEQGLLSVAFAPDYATSGYFYVWYTGGGGAMVLSRFRVSDDPEVADPDSEQIILSVAQPFANHNGGRLQFGPDGMLYLGLGDGGGAGDPQNNSQNGGTLLGKLIRIDVDPANGTYAIPPGNPFASNGSIRDEIWALGLRNPWKISFDPVSGDLYIADVGQRQIEEVSFQAAGAGGGQNYGWNIMEGSQCYGGGGCNQAGLTLPVAEYTHDDGCSITGGEVYRGNDYPAMQGIYFYGDFCSGKVWGLSRDGSQWVSTLLTDTNHLITTFGLGEDGNVYMSSQTQGVYLLSDGEPVSSFTINPGMNDAWYDRETDGQGFLISVFEESGLVFLAWFTYDLERPPEDVTAILGEPGHRWLTAQGGFAGNTAMLDIYVTSGGVFDAPEPAPGPPVKDGTMTIVWEDCHSAVLSYEITSLGLVGEIPLERIVPDNAALCEALQMP
jgi:glucose/arabinose dehydrogenase